MQINIYKYLILWCVRHKCSLIEFPLEKPVIFTVTLTSSGLCPLYFRQMFSWGPYCITVCAALQARMFCAFFNFWIPTWTLNWFCAITFCENAKTRGLIYGLATSFHGHKLKVPTFSGYWGRTGIGAGITWERVMWPVLQQGISDHIPIWTKFQSLEIISDTFKFTRIDTNHLYPVKICIQLPSFRYHFQRNLKAMVGTNGCVWLSIGQALRGRDSLLPYYNFEKEDQEFKFKNPLHLVHRSVFVPRL